jgi:hypothetical protein
MLLGFALLTSLAGIPAAEAQTSLNIVGRAESIPIGFKTYSLFLICNPAWLDPSKSGALTDLYSKYQAFGRSIGDDQAAVWFWRTTVRKGWEKTQSPVDVIDVERSAKFCQAWQLKPSDGPYLVVTTSRPDEQHLAQGTPSDSAVYKLGAMAPSDIAGLLEKLTDALLLTGKPVMATDETSSNHTPASTALWIRMLSATQELINKFGCAWSLKIDAGALSANLASCKEFS